MTPAGLAAANPVDLLEILRSFPPLENFHLIVLEQMKGADARRVRPCGLAGENPFCLKVCGPAREEALQTAISTNQPIIFSCPVGLLNFAVPFEVEQFVPLCLIAGGVREESLDLTQLQALTNAETVDRHLLLERLENLPWKTRREVEQAAAEVQRFLPTLINRDLHAAALNKVMRRVKAVNEIAREIEAADSLNRVAAQLCETAVVLFDIPRVALAVAEREGGQFRIVGGLGIPHGAEGTVCGPTADLLRPPLAARKIGRAEIETLFPGIDEGQAVCLPVAGLKEIPGLLFLFGAELQDRDLLLLDLLAAKVAAKLIFLRREEEYRLANTASQRLLSMIGTLAQIKSREELYFNIVEMSADLLGAANGSLMLIDGSGENLRIEAVKGMSLPLARSMSVRLGAGIAGKVARSGFPLLVNDIEKDSRVAIANRPRFRTKSFISLPIRPKDAVIGVLNLADKEGTGIFSETDLSLLTAFVANASVMIERIMALERATLLEELSVTDSLTGLYNRRFLEKRLEEELSRSCRQNLQFTLILLDLDNFKAYNDLCGHLAGDNALRGVSHLLRESAREMDIVTRYGGEEFCVVLPGTSKKEAIFVAERIRRAIEKEPFPHESRLPLRHLTASLGVACYPEDGSTTGSLIHAADLALYQAKSEGRNRMVLFDPSLRGSNAHQPEPLPNQGCR